VFDQTRLNRLAAHFIIIMFGHQTMFDDVWSPNIYRLSRPLGKKKLVDVNMHGLQDFSLNYQR